MNAPSRDANLCLIIMKKDYLKFISRYNILCNGKHVECNIIGWRTALAHARKYAYDLFNQERKVEILNAWTAEIIDLQEAEKRAAKVLAKRAFNKARQ